MIVSSTELFRVPNLFGIVCDGSAERVYPWGECSIAYIYCMSVVIWHCMFMSTAYFMYCLA